LNEAGRPQVKVPAFTRFAAPRIRRPTSVSHDIGTGDYASLYAIDWDKVLELDWIRRKMEKAKIKRRKNRVRGVRRADRENVRRRAKARTLPSPRID
jgi:hypothetical protein